MASSHTVSEGNAEQLKAWDGDEGAHFARYADQYDASLRVHHHALMTAAGISSRDRVLDIGCGAGATTCDAGALAPRERHLGIDLSRPMLAVARERAAARNLTNIDFVHGDAQVQKFEPAVFDVAISRNGSMFFDDQVKAFANIASAMKPDASLVLLTWQGFTENDWLQQLRHIMAAGRDIPPPDPNKPGPFAFSDPDHIQNVLMSTGFAAVKCETLRRPLYFGVDVAAAEQLLHSQFAWMLEGLDIPTREQTLSQLHTDLAEHLTPEGVAYDSATWLVTAKRR